MYFRIKDKPVSLSDILELIPRRQKNDLTVFVGDGNLSSNFLGEGELHPTYKAAIERGKLFDKVINEWKSKCRVGNTGVATRQDKVSLKASALDFSIIYKEDLNNTDADTFSESWSTSLHGSTDHRLIQLIITTRPSNILSTCNTYCPRKNI